MAPESVDQYLDVHGMHRLTDSTMTSRDELDAHLAMVAQRGVAWEHEEFVSGMTCAAAGVRNQAGMIVGAVAISAPSESVDSARERRLAHQLRDASKQVSRYYRSGRVRGTAA